MTLLDELSEAARTVARRLDAPTVAIGRGGRGTGIVVAPGRVLTNAHNLRDRTTTVTFADGRTVQASLVGADPDGDLAVVEADTAGVDPIVWAEAPPAAGDAVFGASRAGGRLRVTFGLVTSVDAAFRGPRGRLVGSALEHCAPLVRGSSGGALVDREGRVVAINTHRSAPGFYTARSADADLRALVERLAAGDSVVRRSLGVALAPSHVARRLRRAVGLAPCDGLLVRAVVADSAAARAGVREGDLLVTASGAPLDHADRLHDAMEALGDDDTLEIGVLRGTEELTIAVSWRPDGPAHEGEA